MLSMFGLSLSAQTFEKTYPVSPYQDLVTSVLSDASLNTYVTVVGTEFRTDSLSTRSHFYLLKLDSLGNTVYKKNLKSTDLSSFFDSTYNNIRIDITTKLGNELVHFGSIRTALPQEFSSIKIKTDLDLVPISYSVDIPRKDTQVYYSSIEYTNNSFSLFGSLYDYNIGVYYGIVNKYGEDSLTDSKILFNHSDSLYTDFISASLLNSQNHYLFSTGYLPPFFVKSRMQLIKLDSNFNFLNRKFLHYPRRPGETAIEGAFSASWETDTSFILAIATPVNGMDLKGDIFLFKYDTAFNQLAYNRVTAVDTSLTSTIGSMVYDSLCDCYYFGVSQRHQEETDVTYSALDTAEFRLIKFDRDLKIIWDKYYLRNLNLSLERISSDARGNVILAGSVYDSTIVNPRDRHIYVMKVDSMGNLLNTSIRNVHGISSLNYKVYPNPVKNEIKLLKYNQFKPYDFELFNAFGSLVRTVSWQEDFQTIDVSSLASGMYVYRIIDQDGKTGSGKLIVE
jgi:hypothetical protein